MPGRHAPRPLAVPQVQLPSVDDTATQRALDTLASAVQQLQANRASAALSVTGSRSSGAALENLLTVLAEAGIITDNTTA